MGTWINLQNHIDIAEKFWEKGDLKFYGHQELTEAFIEEIVKNPVIQYIQISSPLPEEAFHKIDYILSHRPDLWFRIYGLYNAEAFDLSCLFLLKHLRKLELDIHLRNRLNLIDCNILCDINNLQSLYLKLFDLRDYSFLKNLSTDLKELYVFADTMQGSINFNCEWLVCYKTLESLYLGKKAKKHIQTIGSFPALKNLTLRGITVNDFEFLRNRDLESIAIHWCSMHDLQSLHDFKSLKKLELWRIVKLDNISFISTLTGLESLYLRDLHHISELPDLSGIRNLREVKLDHVPIDIQNIPEDIRNIVLSVY